MNYKKLVLTLLLFYLMSILIFPIHCDTAILQYDRNEYYETCEIAYNMEDKYNGTALFDFALNNNHGNISLGTEGVDGRYGKAIDSPMEIVAPDINVVSQSWTLESWVYPTSDGISYWVNDNGTYPNTMKLANESMHIAYGGGGSQLSSNVSVILNKWNYVALVYDYSTPELIWYINDTSTTVCECRRKIVGVISWQEIIVIGRLEEGYSSLQWSGKLDEFRFYKGEARTKTEIETDMQTSMAVKLSIEYLEANEDVVQLRFSNETIFEQQTADSEGIAEFNVYSFSAKTSEYEGIVNVYHEDIQYEGYVMVLYWGDVYRFTVVGLFADLFTQLFFGTGAWLGILVLILGSLLGLKFYKYTAIIFSTFFILLGLQYYQQFTTGANDLIWFWVFCWVMPIFLIFAMFKLKR